ncbi:ER-derived vesicles protein ERV41 [Escovopsis weberi]|uniref:Endoplasmic reticulum-Golgi intermediate compartment protein n=1 Tax=Escovopsis weberi TaxID=150374 RepID=A0A0M9VXB3_ESCWE|nr:ER-derived vesicles protein ERV41 [Escovopsis weberi]
MNGFEKNRMNEDDFGASGSIVSAFDAFPKSKPQYVEKTSGGGKWTVAMVLVSLVLLWAEAGQWWRGTESHTFAVEKGVGHVLQINLDIVVRMLCSDIHINVQDASGDRIMAAARLARDPTNWDYWANDKGVHRLGRDADGKIVTKSGWLYLDHDEGFGEEHVHDIVALGNKRAKWGRTPGLRGPADSCRVYGSLELNKVQGDFHITARGHGYMEVGAHLEHEKFNFSHIISEMSFGRFYPSLVNPLDNTVNQAEANFHKFQYYLSLVPTVYSTGRRKIFTNQYAVTEQGKVVTDHNVPGIFFKYDIEPIMLAIDEERDNLLSFAIKLINIVSGVLVAGHWGFTLTEWAWDVAGKRRMRRSSGGLGVLGNDKHHL